MTQKEKMLFLAVKTDNLSSFSEFIRENEKWLSARFGRYPLLSLCYLYKSEKIILEYENKLLKTYDYTLLDEPFEIFLKFKDFAKKALRLYVLEKNIITPLEMLAILEDSERLKLKYNDGVKTIKIVNNIAKIYDINHNQIIKQTENKIFTKKKKLSALNKTVLICSVVCSLIFMAIFPILINQVPKIYGNGSLAHPYQVHSEKQFLQAISDTRANIVLKKDIIVNNYSAFGNSFSGNIDGNGNTITFGNYKGKNLFEIFSGKLSNFNIIIENAEYEVLKNNAIIAINNNGEINNTKINFSGKISTKSENVEGDILILSSFVVENNGTIDNCILSLDLKINGSGKDTFFSGFVGKNNKMISNVLVSESSKIESETVDISGICYTSSSSAKIENANNFADIVHISSMDMWTPNIAGIVFQNNGVVVNCSNYGNLTAKTTSFNSNAIVGGIAVDNNLDILKCTSEASLSVSSPKSDVFLGGITVYNKGTVTKSFSKGKVFAKINDSSSGFLLCGGISVDNAGIIEQCFSSVSYDVSGGNKKVGGISSMVLSDINYLINSIFPNINYQSIDCYFLNDTNINSSDAVFYFIENNTKRLTDLIDNRGGCKKIETMEELMQIAGGVL